MFLLRVILIVSIALASAIMEAEHNLCGENEGSDLCGRMCEPSCGNPHPNPAFCPKLQCTRFTESCRCHKGYLRNSSGGCSLQEDCPNNTKDQQ